MPEHNLTRKWLPNDWHDESIPPPMPSQLDFVEWRSATGWCLTLPPDDPDRDEFMVRLVPGAEVAWTYMEDFGEYTITITDDGYVLDRDYPKKANNFLDFVSGDLYKSPRSFADVMRDESGPGGTYQVQIYYWSKPMLYRFDVIDGQPLFILDKTRTSDTAHQFMY